MDLGHVVHGLVDMGHGVGVVDRGNDGGGVGVVNQGSGVSVGHDGGNGLTHGVNETVLVDVLGESLEGERTKASAGGDEVTEGGGEGTGGQAGSQVRVGGRGGQGTANEGTHRNKGLHVGLAW